MRGKSRNTHKNVAPSSTPPSSTSLQPAPTKLAQNMRVQPELAYAMRTTIIGFDSSLPTFGIDNVTPHHRCAPLPIHPAVQLFLHDRRHRVPVDAQGQNLQGRARRVRASHTHYRHNMHRHRRDSFRRLLVLVVSPLNRPGALFVQWIACRGLKARQHKAQVFRPVLRPTRYCGLKGRQQCVK